MYRTLNFDDVFSSREEYDAFVARHQEGLIVAYKAYTSASLKEDGYPLPDGVKYGITLEIIGENARNLTDVGNNFENEVLFPRRSRFDITKVETDKDGRTRICMKEI